MPFFKSTHNILFDTTYDEVYDENWMDTPFLQLPDKQYWDYSREMKIEDVDIWEVIVENGGGSGLYAAYSPYAEFYMLLLGNKKNTNDRIIETFYGKNCQGRLQKRLKEINMIVPNNIIWVDQKDMWMYVD
jgi:hypothetical protein